MEFFFDIIQEIERRCINLKWKVSVGISNRHAHLTKETYESLFTSNYEKIKDLKQTNEFASNKTLTLEGPNGLIENVRILGPFRSYNQIEISKSDAHILGINPPVRKSGDLENSETITLIGEKGKITLKNSCILAENHIHMNYEDLKKYDVENGSIVKVTTNGMRKGTFYAHIKASKEGVLEFHIDRDEANAFLITNGEELIVEK